MKGDQYILGQLIADDSAEFKLKIKRLHEDAIIPTRGTVDSAGLDIYALEDYDIPAQGSVAIHTGIAMEIPKGYFGLLAIRSGLATKRHLRLTNGVGIIDSDYRGEIIASIFNDNPIFSGKQDCVVPSETIDAIYHANIPSVNNISSEHIEKGERIAQLILLPYISPKIVETDDLSDTERSTGEFGSTGRK